MKVLCEGLFSIVHSLVLLLVKHQVPEGFGARHGILTTKLLVREVMEVPKTAKLLPLILVANIGWKSSVAEDTKSISN